MASAPSPTITVGGQEYAEPLADVIAGAFESDPLNRYIVLSGDPSLNDVKEKRKEGILGRIKNRAEAGAHLVEAGNWAAAALWFPPGTKEPPPDRTTTPPAILEYVDKFEKVKERWLGGGQYWYLNLLGRTPGRTEPGVVRALIDTYLEKAQNEGIPAWLEATNEHARDIYIHFGFRVVEDVVLGEGKCDRLGNLVEGGEGVRLYAMITEPKEATA